MSPKLVLINKIVKKNMNFRWDFEKTELLPKSMKFCMKLLYDTVDEIGHELLEGKGWTVQQHIQNAVSSFRIPVT